MKTLNVTDSKLIIPKGITTKELPDGTIEICKEKTYRFFINLWRKPEEEYVDYTLLESNKPYEEVKKIADKFLEHNLNFESFCISHVIDLNKKDHPKEMKKLLELGAIKTEDSIHLEDREVLRFILKLLLLEDKDLTLKETAIPYGEHLFEPPCDDIPF